MSSQSKPKTAKAACPLKPKVRDTLPAIYQAAISTLAPPLGLITSVIQAYIGTPASRRGEEFILDINKRLIKLEESGIINLRELLNNPLFQTIIINATQIAMKTHQQEKLEAIRNTVINSAISNSVEEDLKIWFLNTIDNLTSSHLKLLLFLSSPREIIRRPGDIPETIIYSLVVQSLPEFGDQVGFYQQIMEDLTAKGLLNSHLSPVSIKDKWFLNLMLPLGELLISLIKSPSS